MSELNIEIKLLLDFFINKKIHIYLVDWVDIDSNSLKSDYIFDFKNMKVIKNKSLNDLSDVIVVRYVGSIESRYEKFKRYLNALKKFNGLVINNIESMMYGIAKEYLFFLQKNDLPVINSVFLPKTISRDEIPLEKNEYSKYLVKPISGECGNSITKISDIDKDFFARKQLKVQGWILQPIISGICDGEISLIFINQRFSHAVKKIPQNGNLQINAAWNPIYKIHNPTTSELKLCKKIINIWKYQSFITRFDLIYDNGILRIMEVETVNPNFYLEAFSKDEQNKILNSFYKLIMDKKYED